MDDYGIYHVKIEYEDLGQSEPIMESYVEAQNAIDAIESLAAHSEVKVSAMKSVHVVHAFDFNGPNIISSNPTQDSLEGSDNA